jgi:hypothetical protein
MSDIWDSDDESHSKLVENEWNKLQTTFGNARPLNHVLNA